LKQCRCLSLTEKTRRCCRGRCSLTDKEGEILASTRQAVPESYRLSMQPPDRCSKTADSPLATVSSSSHHPWLRTCFRFVSQTHLLIGLEEYGLHDSDNPPRVGNSLAVLCRFFQTYITSTGDKFGQEVDTAAVSTTWFTAIRPEYRGAVRHSPSSLDGRPASPL
jgi:hypothetical protein